MKKNKQQFPPKSGRSRTWRNMGRLVMLALFWLVTAQAYADRWDGGYKAEWKAAEGCFELSLRFYDSTGRDDVLQDGEVTLNNEKILYVNGGSHHSYPYHVDLTPYTLNDKYSFQVQRGENGTWESLDGPKSDVNFSWREDSGSGSFYYIRVRVYPNYFKDTNGNTYNFKLTGEIDRNSTSVEDVDVTHNFSCTPKTDYNTTVSLSTNWVKDKKMELKWSSNNGNTKVSKLTVTLDGEKKEFSGSIPNPIVVNNYWSGKIDKLLNNTCDVNVTAAIQPKNSAYYSFDVKPTHQTKTFGQAEYLTPNFYPADSDGNPNRIELKWGMTEKASSSPMTNKFLIKRYKKNEDEYVFEKEYTADYAKGTKEYTFTDDDLEPGGVIDYRYDLSRNVDITGYPVQTNSLTVSTLHCSPDTIWAYPNEAGDQVIVEWKDNDIIWSQATECTLTQIDLETMDTYEMRLSEEDYRAKRYVATRVKNCGSYEYTLEIVPGDKENYPVSSSVTTKEPVSPYKPGTIEGFSVSKGYFTDRTELSWESYSAFNNFIIERKPYDADDSEYKQIGSVSYESALSNYSYDDRKGAVGTIYEYRVFGVVQCVDVKMYSVDTLKAVGFRSSTGVISGRVTYENGQAVQGVEILPQSDNMDNGKAIRLDGTGGIKTDKGLTLPAAGFTLEMYVRPNGESAGKTLMSIGDKSVLGFNTFGKASFMLGTRVVTDTVTHQEDSYYHLSAVYDGTTMRLYVDSLLVGTTEAPGLAVESAPLVVGAIHTGNGYTNSFQGYVDEVRVWSKALSREEILRDYTRQLYGGETGLMLYYRFNEGVLKEVYDMSFEGDTYHEMHATAAGMTYADDPTELPSMEQLAIKGITDINGNYIINGVPYASNGTQYRIIPRYGTHKFDPTERLITMNENNRDFTADFKDNSSFRLSGRVLYSESTIPVEGVMFEIDGVTSMVDGKVVTTNSLGEFEISVPVGQHKVRAVLTNHTFRNDGYLLDENGEHRFYNDVLEDVIFRDETRVRFIGRVAGGPVQQAYPLGHSLSKNNLGENPTVRLELSGSASNMFNIYENEAEDATDTQKSMTVQHFRPTAWGSDPDLVVDSTRVTFYERYIEIKPALSTGEFFVDLIPTTYDVVTATTTGHSDILADPMTMNAKDSLLTKYSTYEFVLPDSLRKAGIDTIAVDSVPYQLSAQFIKRVNPSMEVNQVSKSGEPLDYWGNTEYLYNTVTGKIDTISIFDPQEIEDDRYLFGKPLMQQGETYEVLTSLFEAYSYYESDGGEAVEVPEKRDKVAVTDGVVRFTNDLKSIGAVDTVHVKSDGTAVYRFVCGAPNLTSSDGTSKLEVTVQIDDRTIDATKTVNAIVVGSVEGNNNFVTAGPDIITTVLRDPPGSNSYSFLEAGTSYEYSTSYIGSMNLSQEVGSELLAAASIKTFVGLGAGTQTSVEVGEESSMTGTFEENVEGTEGTVSRMTFTNRWQTSDDPAYVGADADVYIGKSTNVIIGPANAVEIVRDGEFNPDFVEGIVAKNNGYSLVRRETMNMGLSFSTMFAYPQIHIESVLIPNLKKVMRDQFNDQVKNDSEAQALANQTKEIVYTTDITDMDDPNFGTEGTYKVFIPEPKEDFVVDPAHSNLDTIMTMRQSIDNWEKAIADNERKKLTAAKSGENISFHAGASVERTMEYSGSDVQVTTFSIMTGAHQTMSFKSLINDAGLKTTLEMVESMTHGGEFSTTQEATRTFGFVLAEDGTDYISVDVRKVDNDQKLDDIISDAGGNFGENWGDLLDNADELKGEQQEYVFITRGGATSCPWEAGSVSKYYNPGSQMDQPTAQMEKPVLTLESNTVKNVPASRRAVFKLNLGNQSETDDDQYFMLSQIDASNPDGAKFYVDGTPLGEGRTFLVPAGSEPLVKTLEVERGTAMVYNDLQLSLHSLCQYDPTGFQDLIESTVNLNVEFVPACTDLVLASPLDKWVLNSESPYKTEDGKYIVPVTVNDFDVNYENFHHIDIQMKASHEPDNKWTTKARFYKSKEDLEADTEAMCEKIEISGAEVTYNIILDEKTDVDQNYDICAVSACKMGADVIETVSNISTITKDTYRPRLFGQPQPADGILGVEDEIRLNFNENIAAGYITADNVSATGIRVGTENPNNASVSFDGVSEYAATELPKNFTGKNFTVEANILFDEYKEEVIFAIGDETNPFEIGFDADGYLIVKIGTSVLKSSLAADKQLQGQWQHVAVVYEQEGTPSVTGYVDLKEVLAPTEVEAYTGIGNYVIGRGLDNTRHFHGRLNELRVWTEPQTYALLNKNRGVMLSGAEAGLLNYYPMTDGRGEILEDKAGSNHAALHAAWYVTDPGFAIYLNGDAYLQYPTSSIIITDEMDYTVEFWFKSDAGTNANAALFSNGKANNEDNNLGERHIYVGFEDGALITRNNGYTDRLTEDLHDGDWHHYALTVSRSMDKASVYIDGTLKSWFAASYFDGISAEYITIGACRWTDNDGMSGIGEEKLADYFTGRMDEVRLWNVAMNETLINQRCNTRQEGNEDGLLLYLPFEQAIRDVNSNIINMNYYLNSLVAVNNETVEPMENTGALKSEDAAGMKDVSLESNISMEVVVNDDALILTPKSGINEWNNFEQQIVTFTVKDIQDMNGNRLESDVVWTAFIDRNHLKWSEENIHVECSVYEGADFSVDIVNIGGMNQSYTLQGMPSWLDVSSTSGNIAPKASTTIDFHVSEVLNVGTYDQVVYLINDNGVARALNLTVKVNGETPDWSVDASKYEYNMNIYGKLKVNNVFSSDEEDMLAAFQNGQCVGVAHNTYVKKYDMWYTLLTVYSNEPSHDDLEFRIWDASTGTIYIGEPAKNILFKNDAIEGSPVSPVVFETKDLRIQNIALNAGWNWVSFNVGNEPNMFDRLFANGEWMTGDQVKDETNNTFAAYATEGWTGPFADMEVSYKNMYLVKTSNEQILSFSGTPLKTMEERTVPLRPKWNYIAFLPTTNLTVQEALTGYEATEGDIVKDQSSFSMYSETIGWLGSLEYMKPGVGYMFYRSAADSAKIIYPLLTANTSTRAAKMKSETAVDETFAYPANMSVVAVVDGSISLEAGDRIVAFINGERRGVSTSVAHPTDGSNLHYLSVGGDNPAAVTFALEHDGEIIAESRERIDFTPDAVVGNIRTPYVINFTDGHAGLVYPTLFEDKLNVNLSSDEDADVNIRLIDLYGRVLHTYNHIEMGEGGLLFTIDGLSNLSSGMYMVDIRVNGQSNIHKVEKK